MSGLEVAGVVLGAVPLILYALDTYRASRRHRETIETIRSKIFVNRRILITTLQSLDPTFSENTQIADIKAALEHDHPAQAEEFMRIIVSMDENMNDIARKLYPDAQGPPDWNHAYSDRVVWEWRNVKNHFGSTRREKLFEELAAWNKALQGCGLGKREFAPDNEAPKVIEVQGRYDELGTASVRQNAHALHDAITSNMGCTCSSDHAGNIQLNWHESKRLTPSVFSLALSSKKSYVGTSPTPKETWEIWCATIEQYAMAASTSVPSTPIMSPLSSSSSAASISQQSNSQASMTQQSNASSLKPQGIKKKSVRIFGREITLSDSKRKGSISPQEQFQTVCSLQAAPVSTPSSTLAAPQILLATAPIKLCTLLQSAQSLDSHPVPSTALKKQIRFKAPAKSANPLTTSPERTVPLPTMLRREIDPVTQKKFGLDWKQQFKTAAALAWAVLNLCGSPWLKDDSILNDDEIHFFLEQQTINKDPEVSAYPYLIHCFRSGQSPASPSCSDSNMQFQKNQVQNQMLFGLAVRLIELALNKPFAELRQATATPTAASRPTTPLQTTSSNPSTVIPPPVAHTTTAPVVSVPSPCTDYMIAQQELEEVGKRMGQFYKGAVESCLRFGQLDRIPMNTFENSSFRKSFFDAVVAPIQATLELRLNL